MREIVLALFIFVLSSACFASAFEAEILLVDDIGSFSGAVLKLKSSPDGELGDKIFPSEYMTSAGVVKFNIETSISEVYLYISIVKNGNVVDIVEEGPFVVDGSQILIDRREGAEEAAARARLIVENDSGSDNNTATNTSLQANTNLIKNVSSKGNVSNSSTDESSDVAQIGWLSVFDAGDTWPYYLIGGLLTFVVLMVVWFKFEVFRYWLTRMNYFSDDGELARIEAEITEKQRLINRVKEKRERKRKIALARKRLRLKTKKLENMIKRNMKRKKSS